MTANRKWIPSCLVAGVIWLGVISVLGSCASKTPAPTPTPTKTPRPSVVTLRPTDVEPVIVAVAAITVGPSPMPTHTAAVTPLPAAPTAPTPEPTGKPAIVQTRQPTSSPTEQAVATRAPAPRYPQVGDYFGRGIRVAFGSQSDFEFVTNKAAELKVKWVQFDVLWGDVEPAENQHDWSQLDQAINAFSAAGLRLLATVHSAPSWARNANSDLGVEGPPADPQDIRQVCDRSCQSIQGQSPGHRSLEWRERMVQLGARAVGCRKICGSAVRDFLCCQGSRP